MSRELRAREVRLVCLAGFMRLVGPPLLNAFPNAILNVHPSLLPAFPGVDAQRQAFAHGVKISGATVHLVTGELDGGPIVLQSAVPVRDDDTADRLSARILIEEHKIYPEAVQVILDGGWRIEGRRLVRSEIPIPNRESLIPNRGGGFRLWIGDWSPDSRHQPVPDPQGVRCVTPRDSFEGTSLRS